MMIALRIVLATVLALLLAAEQLHAQDSIDAARDLYASAQYDEALKVLDRLSPAASSANDRQSIDLYRTLCLLAIGRRDEADRAIEAIVMRDPLYRPGDELSPRTRIAFSDARKRVLPAIVQQQYADAKNVFDRKDFESAAAAFKRVLDALNDPDMETTARQSPLSDLRTLAVGFHDLSVKAIPPPPPPTPPVAPVATPVNVPPKIYSGDEPGLRPAATIAQDMPRYPSIVPAAGIRGAVEIIIGEKGTVESAMIVTPVSTTYDKLVLAAAHKWQFVPATMNGTPVKFRKRIQIYIAPPTR